MMSRPIRICGLFPFCLGALLIGLSGASGGEFELRLDRPEQTFTVDNPGPPVVPTIYLVGQPDRSIKPVRKTKGVRLGGTAPNTEELHNLLKALGKAKTLANVEINDQKIKDNKCQFEIAAQLSDRYVPTEKKKEEDEKDAAKEKAAGDKKEPPAKEAEPAQAGAKTEAEDKAKDKGKDQAPQPQPPALASPGTSQPDSTQPGTGKPDTGEADAGNADAAQDGAIEPGGGS